MFWARIAAIAILLLVAVVKPKVDAWLGDDAQSPQTAATPVDRTATGDDTLINPDDFIAQGSAAATGPSQTEPPATAPSGTRSSPEKGANDAQTPPPGRSNNAAGDVATLNPDKSSTGGAGASRPDKNGAESQRPVPGKLKLVDKARQKFQSTAGLLYVQGSADGHRLKHVLKHARDIPDKNIHGVFDGDGDRDKILAWIDIAYEAGKKGGRGTKVERQGGRVVYTVRMSQRIGFVGGRAGQRDNFPECRYLRLVVQNGNEVVTAYPSRSL